MDAEVNAEPDLQPLLCPHGQLDPSKIASTPRCKASARTVAICLQPAGHMDRSFWHAAPHIQCIHAAHWALCRRQISQNQQANSQWGRSSRFDMPSACGLGTTGSRAAFLVPPLPVRKAAPMRGTLRHSTAVLLPLSILPSILLAAQAPRGCTPHPGASCAAPHPPPPHPLLNPWAQQPRAPPQQALQQSPAAQMWT